MANIWSSTTFHDRRQLIQRWLDWCTLHQLEPAPATAALWVTSIPQISLQTQLAYAKALSGAFRQVGLERSDLLSLASALRAQGAMIPEKQAAPLRLEDLVRWLSSPMDPMLRLSVMVCWKTASRWGEVALLTADHFISVADNEVIVAWGTLPKGRRADPYTPSMYTVIVGQWTDSIAKLLALVPNRSVPFCPWTTDKLERQLKLVPFLSTYTAHSFKRGAATHIIREGQRSGEDIRPQDISLLLKHRLTYDLLSAADLRYPEAGPSLARFLGTQRVTRLL